MMFLYRIIFQIALRLIILPYFLLLFVLVLLRRQLVYKPRKKILSPDMYGLEDFEEIGLKTSDNVKIKAWYYESEKDTNSMIIVYFHGNAGNLAGRAKAFKTFTEDGGCCLMGVSYRGFGNSDGKPNEEGLYRDARASIEYLLKKGALEERMIFYGESLGTAVAAKMATEYHPKLLVLQSPFTSIVDRGQEIYWYAPIKFLSDDKFDTLSIIKDINCPLLIFHGKNDKVVPKKHSEKIFNEANEPKKRILFDGVGHSDFDNHELIKYMKDFIKEI